MNVIYYMNATVLSSIIFCTTEKDVSASIDIMNIHFTVLKRKSDSAHEEAQLLVMTRLMVVNKCFMCYRCLLITAAM